MTLGSVHKELRGSFNPWLREDSQRFLRLTGAGQQLPGQSLAVSGVQHRGVPACLPQGQGGGPSAGPALGPRPPPAPLLPVSWPLTSQSRWQRPARGPRVDPASEWRARPLDTLEGGVWACGRHAPAGHACPPPLVPPVHSLHSLPALCRQRVQEGGSPASPRLADRGVFLGPR